MHIARYVVGWTLDGWQNVNRRQRQTLVFDCIQVDHTFPDTQHQRWQICVAENRGPLASAYTAKFYSA
jgi:hypothetical protein